MTAVGRLVRASRSRRAEDVSLTEFGDLMLGRSPGASGMSTRRAMGLSAWYSGVRYLSESLAYLPVTASRLRGGDQIPRSLPTWVKTPEVDRFGRPVMTRGRLIELWIGSLIHRGNGYGFKLRDDLDRVVGMRYLHPDRVKIRIEAGDKLFDVDMTGNGDRRTFTARDVFHLVGLSDNGVTGYSVIEYQTRTLETAAAAEDFARSYFLRGTLLSSYIQLTANTRKPPEEIKAEFAEFYEGIENAHKGAVLSNGAEFRTVTLNARDAQVLEARQWSVLEMARLLRVPPHKLYDLSRATFSNIEQQSIEAVQDGPRVWAGRLEEQISADPDLMPADTTIRFDLDGLTRGDTAAEVAALHDGIRDGYVSLADARKRRGLPPAPGMDVVYRPADVHTVDLATGRVIVPAGAAAADVSDTSDDDQAAAAATIAGEVDDVGPATPARAADDPGSARRVGPTVDLDHVAAAIEMSPAGGPAGNNGAS